jgi:hypothetical protein
VSLLVPLVMFGWIPFVIYMFSIYEAPKACLISILVAWLFLPNAKYPLAGLPDYNKVSATCYGIVISAWMFDRKTLSAWRPCWLDFPMGIFCFSPFLSSISNDLGPYDGFSCALAQTVTWGLPYMIGRVYFGSSQNQIKMVSAIVIGGLIYVPLCLLEIKMSPQLHKWVYGYHVADFGQSIRYGGYRPTVFMEHGLMVGMWMATATLCAFWILKTESAPQWMKFRSAMISCILLVTLILVKSTGAIALFLLGLGLMSGAKKFKLVWPIWVMIVLPIMYLGGRSSGSWDGQSLVEWSEKVVNTERSQSLAFRIDNEELIAAKAMHNPWLGWADWGRWRVYNDAGDDITISDSLWCIILGRNGRVGLYALYVVLLLPLILVTKNIPAKNWFNAQNGALTLLAMLCTLYAIDCLFNAMVNPTFALISGAVLASLAKKQTTPSISFQPTVS